MKACIITFQYARNYGAMLQAYALKHRIETMGHQCQIIDYVPEKEACQQSSIFMPFSGYKSYIVNAFSILHYSKLKRCTQGFRRFAENYFDLTPRYSTLEELKLNPPKADIYITGSDQVWNCSNGVDPAYFLEFGKKYVKRYSYAASIGRGNISKEYHAQIAQALDKFNGISVREETAQKILNEISDLECDVHLDPVFLLSQEEWSSIALPYQIKKPYILCYSLSTNHIFNKNLLALKRKTGLEIVEICATGFSKVKSDNRLFDVSPQEFLSLVKNAEYVFTSSFHGAAMSILFNRNFYTCNNGVGSSRIDDLLEKFDLQYRNIANTDILENGIDYINYVNHNVMIQKEKQNALEYLFRILNDVI